MYLRVIAVLFAICLGFSAEAAEREGFDLGFARPGMRLSEFRTAFDNDDIKVICSGESESIAPVDAAFLTVEETWSRAGIGRCRHFKKDGKGIWKSVLVKIGDICCTDLSVITLKIDNTTYVSQISARIDLNEFMNLVIAFSVEYGNASEFDGRRATWNLNGQTAIIIHDDEKTYLIIYDNALRQEFDARSASSK